MPAVLRSIALLVVCSLLVACGFQLRGSYSFPFDSLYLSMPETSVIGAQLRRSIRASNPNLLVPQASEAQVILLPGTEYRDRVILTVSGTGRVSELRLRYLFPYRLTDSKGRDLAPPGRIELVRDLTYDDSQVLAKQQEEALLWRDMEIDLVQQLMRRLAAAKPVFVDAGT
jgi:LPS-assembly lipoprotein